MPYLGSTPNASFSTRTKQDFTANGSTTAFTLSSAVASANDIEVFVGNVRQEPTDAYTVNGTTLTMSEAPETGLNFYVVFKGLEENSVVPADGTISSAKIAANAVTTAKIGASQITDAKIASGVSATKLTTGTVPTGRMPAGTPIQIVSFDDNQHRSWSGQGRSTILAVPGTLGDGSVFIDRISNTSKILVHYTICCGQPDDAWSSFICQYAPAGSGYSIVQPQGIAVTGIQNAGCLAHFGTSKQGSRGQYDTESISYTTLLDVSGESTNKIFVRLATSYGHNAVSRTSYLNRPAQVSDNNRFTGVSTVVLTEIAT